MYSQFAKVVFWKNAVRRLVDGIQRSLSRRRVEARSSTMVRVRLKSTSFGEGGNPHQQPLYVRVLLRPQQRADEGVLGGSLPERTQREESTGQPFEEKRLVHHYFNNGLQLHVLNDRFASFTGSPKTPRSQRLDRCPRILDPKFLQKTPSFGGMG